MSVILGIDPFIGGEYFYELLDSLVHFLHGVGINRLSHLKILGVVDNFGNYFLIASHLGLSGSLALEWSRFVLGLYWCGIILSSDEDCLVWGWNNKVGTI